MQWDEATSCQTLGSLGFLQIWEDWETQLDRILPQNSPGEFLILKLAGDCFLEDIDSLEHLPDLLGIVQALRFIGTNEFDT